MQAPFETELLELSQRLLDAVAAGDWHAYESLCAPDLTCFEPESQGECAEGLDFHRFYFERDAGKRPPSNTIVSARVVELSKTVALVCYVRLVQRVDAQGVFHTDRFGETRIWKKTSEGWKHVHFHRSVS